jgi:hypothetical protein
LQLEIRAGEFPALREPNHGGIHLRPLGFNQVIDVDREVGAGMVHDAGMRVEPVRDGLNLELGSQSDALLAKPVQHMER